MPGLGRKVFTAGEVLTAANVQNYLQDQVVQVYAGTAARASVVGTAASEGMIAYLSDFNTLDFFDGTSWNGINYRTVTTATATANTAVIAWAGELIVANNAAAMTVTVPDVFAVGQGFEVVREGAGTVVLAAGSGVTSWAGAGTAGTAVTFKLDQQYNGVQVLKTAANTYRVIGRAIP